MLPPHATTPVAVACASLRENKLKILDLSNKGLRDDDLIALAEALRGNTSLKELYLSNNKLSDGAIRPLCIALAKHPLEILYFTGNQIGDEGAKHLANYIRQTKHLKWLDLHMNRIGDEGGVALASALHRNASLEGLQLKSNRIGQKGQMKLLVACEINSTLQNLIIGDNEGFYEDVWERMMEQLNVNTKGTLSSSSSSRYVLKFQQKRRAHLTQQFDLNEHLAPFLNNAELSDVKLVSSDGREFFAHRCILYSKCKTLYREIRLAEKKDPSSAKKPFPLSANGETLLRFLKQIYTSPPIISVTVPLKETTPTSQKGNLRSLADSSDGDLSPELSTLLKKYHLLIDEDLSLPAKDIQSAASPSINSNTKSDLVPQMENSESSSPPLCATSVLLMRHRLADISILPKDEPKAIPAHRLILASRSPYFRGMFNSGMREAKENQISILRSASALKVVLEFCYTGDVNQYLDSENAVEVLEAASEFAMDTLKFIIETSLIEAIDAENVMFLLHLANTYQCDALEVACMSFLHLLGNK